MISYYQKLSKEQIFQLQGFDYIEVTLALERNIFGKPKIVECKPRMVNANCPIIEGDYVLILIARMGDAIAMTQDLPTTCVMVKE